MRIPALFLLQSHTMLKGASPEALAISTLWWWMLAVGGVVWLLVTVATLAVARRRRASSPSGAPFDATRDRERQITYVVGACTAGTVAVLVTFLTYDFILGRKLTAPAAPALTISVAAHQWWWEFTYVTASPDSQVIVANELHVPAGVPVRFLLNAGDVIHSFWLPNMNGKRDLVPGLQSMLQFQADTVGTYRGQCAEFCGMQHAKMAFLLVAESKADFSAWLDHQRAPAIAADSAQAQAPATDSIVVATDPLQVAEGREVFLSHSCSTCHAIRGTDAGARVAPDLTHFGSRRTLASVAVANTRANLSTWIATPDRIKPGTQMPATPLTEAELRALVAYVETLR